MNLYIRIKDGQPFEHPLFEDNVKQVWPEIDLNNLPPELAKFERVQPPVVDTFEILEGFSYQIVDGVYKDVWHKRPMNDAEKEEQIGKLTASMNAGKTFLIKQAQEKMETVNDAGKIALQNYITQLTSFTPPDITQYRLPHLPKFDQNGNLVTVNSSGSTPNVIG